MDLEISPQQTFQEGSVSSRIIEPSQLYDPLLVLLKVKLRLKNWWIMTGCGVVATLGVLTVLLTNGWNTSFFSSPLQPLALSAIYLTFVGTYLALPSAVADLLNRLRENGVIGDARADTPGPLSYPAFVEKHVRWMHSRWWAALVFLTATSNPLFLFFVHPIWIGTPLWFTVIGNFIALVGDYVAVFVFAWLVMIAFTTNLLFRAFTVRVKPLHPDGSGGLGLFNHFLWITLPLMIVIGCGIAGWGSLFSQGIDRILLWGDIAFYLLAASLLLVTWIIFPHQAMVQARNKLLQPLTNEYEHVLAETMSGEMRDLVVINEGTERLAALRKRYEEVHDSFPTWPIEIMQLRGLVTLLILPVLLALLPLLLDLFTKK
ncbi:MAG TPA: hypothetical protein VGF67_27860 [Ktedonobacteraceae bacterium]|jgi:hypothetical protein